MTMIGLSKYYLLDQRAAGWCEAAETICWTLPWAADRNHTWN